MISLFEDLKKNLPFSLLDEKALHIIEKSADIAYHKDGTTIISTKKQPEFVYYIIKGVVEGLAKGEVIDIYHEHDSIGGFSILKDELPQYDYVIIEEVIAYEIPREVFLALCQHNKVFKNYFFASIVDRMQMLQGQKESAKISDIMIAKVDALDLRDIVIVDAKIEVKEALQKMCDAKATAVIVQNEEGFGIVTDANLRRYIIDKEEHHLRYIADIQSFPLITTHEDELLFNVQLIMTNKSIKHLPVMDEQGKIKGVIEIADILSHFASQTHLLSSRMDRAQNVEEVIDVSKRLDATIKALHHKGVKSRYIARVVSEIHKKMYAKLFSFIFPKEWQESAILVVLGSEGRGEQIVRTDQDNALIFKDNVLPDDLSHYTQKFTEVLDQIGFPRCEGNVMVINPKWAKSLTAYKKDIDTFIDKPSSENMMDLAILYDAFGVAGNIAILLTLKEYLAHRVKEHKAFIAHFAKPIESFESPLGLFSRFISKKGHENEIDIKKGAIFAIVHGIRALALEHGISKTNTSERIKALNNLDYFSKESATNLMETLEILNNFRLHAQLEKSEHAKKVDNYLNWKSLSKIEKDTLKEALKEVEAFKKQIVYHYTLEVVS